MLGFGKSRLLYFNNKNNWSFENKNGTYKSIYILYTEDDFI